MSNADQELYTIKVKLIAAEASAKSASRLATISLVFSCIAIFGAVLFLREPASPRAAVPAPATPSGVIEGTGFVLRDPQGRPRIMMGMNPDGTAAFGLMGPTSDSHISFAAHGDGALGMAFTQGALPAITLSSTPDGTAGILVGTDHKVAIATATDYRGASVIVQGEGGKVIGKLP